MSKLVILMIFDVEKMNATTINVQAQCAMCADKPEKELTKFEHDKLRWLVFDKWLKGGNYLYHIDKGLQEVYYEVQGSGDNMTVTPMESYDDPHYPIIAFQDGRIVKIMRAIERHLEEKKIPIHELFTVRDKVIGKVELA